MTVTIAAHASMPGRLRLAIFASAADEPRARRASDITLLVTTIVALAATGAAASPLPGFVRALDRFARALPDFLDGIWQIAIDAAAALAAALLVAALVRRRFAVAVDLAVAAVVAIVAWLLVGRMVTGSWPDTWAAIRATAAPPWFPSLRVALPAAVVLTAAPHVTAPIRRVGRWAIAASATGVVVLGSSSSLGALAGFLLAVAVAAAVHLAFGSSAGRPPLGDVATHLVELGVPTTALEAADRQETGPFLVHGRDAAGAPIDVKVYGRDAQDSALLTTLWRTIWFRDSASPLRLGRLQQVESEAFLTLLAAQAGVLTDVVVTAGATSTDDALLVLRPAGPPLAHATPDAARPDALWALVATLHGAGIAHGEIDEHHVVVGDGGRLGLRDFRGGSAAASPIQRRTDEVQALVTTVTTAGLEPAVAAARARLGDEELAAVLPLVQPAVLTPAQRRAAKIGDLDLVALRTHLAEAIGSEVPTLQQLRRLSVGSIVRVVLPALAVIAMLSLVAGIDTAVLAELLADASWWLLAVGLVLAQLPRLTQAISTVGAAPVPLPLGPVYALQLAMSYINIAIPSTAARVALNIRFLQRYGLPPGTALASGALDGFSGFVAQLIILTVLLLFTSVSLDLDLGGAVDGTAPLIVAVVAIAALAVGIVLAVPAVRRFVLGWIRRLAGEALGAVKGLQSPRRLAMLLGGNLASEVLFAIALGVFVAAVGYQVGIGALLLTNISVGLLSGLLPVPGGIGVAEGGLTIGLVQAGVPEEAAFAAVVAYRLATFYLPPIWGYLAMRWLERNEYL